MEHRGVKEAKNWRLIRRGPVRPVEGTSTHGQPVQRERPSASAAATEAISARFAEPERGKPQKVRGVALKEKPVYLCKQPADTSAAKARYVQITVNGVPVFAKVDSGAEESVVPCTFPGIPPKLDRVEEISVGVKEKRLTVLAKDTTETQWKDKVPCQTVYVMSPLREVLLSLPAIMSLGVIRFLDSIGKNKRYDILYPQLFNSLGTLQGEYTIQFTPHAAPFAVNAARRVPIPMMKAVKSEIAKMEELGVIRKVEGLTDWCAGIVPVLKPSGAVCICVDMTQLTKIVRRERYVLRTVEQKIGLLGDASAFFKAECKLGFSPD